MHSSALIAVLLALGATETLGLTAQAANHRRHSKLAIEKIRRGPANGNDAAGNHEHVRADNSVRVDHPLAGGKKGKRFVRKKRGTSNCQVNTGGAAANTTSSTTTTGSGTTTTLGNQNNAANPLTTTTTTHSTTTTTPTTTTTTTSTKPTSTSSWYLTDKFAGNSFFDNWNFWSWSDPTHGTVDYLNVGDAWNSGLISINNQGQALMKIDTTQHVSGGRKSIRIHSNKVWTGGLVLMDASHMPYGCGTWPAWWQNGPNWPYGGEIDILEGVNAFTQNQVSLHTGSGCHMPNNQNSLQSGVLTTGGFDSYNCASYETSNQGCGVRDTTNDNSYGSAFNNVGGGVYAMLWGKVGIKVWWFPRASIPSDINSEQPDPSTWGKPVADFPSTNCNPYQYFYEHISIFDTTLCGDWAGADAVWNYAGYAGQDQSCAAITGYSSCSDYVLNSGSSFSDAYWAINYVKYFNSTSEV